MLQKVKQWIDGWLERIQAADMKSSKSRSILLYLFFVLISAILWCFLTFNNLITVDVELPVNLVSKPANVRLLTHVPDTVTVSVKDKGSSLIKYLFKSPPTLELKFSDYADGDGVFKVDAAQLKKLVQRQLGRNSTIASILPENINVKYTDGPGKAVPVVVDIEVKPELLYTQTGPVVKSADTVMVYGDAKTLSAITEVYTYHVKATQLTDTFRRKVSIAPLRGAVVEPRSIEIMVPIENMASHHQKVQIAVRNVPQGTKVIVFPSSVDVSFRAPVSALKRKGEVTAVVDYNAIVASHTNKVAVTVGEAPASYQDFRLSVDSVEYIVQKLKP